MFLKSINQKSNHSNHTNKHDFVEDIATTLVYKAFTDIPVWMEKSYKDPSQEPKPINVYSSIEESVFFMGKLSDRLPRPKG